MTHHAAATRTATALIQATAVAAIVIVIDAALNANIWTLNNLLPLCASALAQRLKVSPWPAV